MNESEILLEAQRTAKKWPPPNTFFLKQPVGSIVVDPGFSLVAVGVAIARDLRAVL